jgi:predicted ATPase
VTKDTERLFVLTGGPGSGKTTLIEALARAGHAGSLEAGRAIIQDQVAIDGPALPWRDPRSFAELMLCWEIRSWHMADSHAVTFFDRGVPDVVGYMRLLGLPVPAHMHNAAQSFRYNGRVFITPPWPEIFQSDRERKQTLDEAVRTYDAMVSTYTHYGYELIELPRATVEDRVRFVLERAGVAGSGAT